MILNQYCFASGQEINLNKSGLFTGPLCPQQLQNSLANTLRKIGKYLGFPNDWGDSKKQMFAWINDRVNMKLEGWKEKLISKGGKETLIKTVVQAIPQYAMSIFKIPLSIFRSIEKKTVAFWWKNSESKTGLH